MISIDWTTRIITIPDTDLTFISGTLYELSIPQLFDTLKDIEDSDDGMVNPAILDHNPEAVLSGDTFAEVVKIINGYTVSFSHTGHITVKCIGANHNLGDVTNFNDISLVINNSAGLIKSDNIDALSKDIKLIKTLTLLKL